MRGKRRKMETAVKGRWWQSNWNTCLASDMQARLHEEAGKTKLLEAATEDQSLFCAPFWSNINVPV